MKKLVSLFLAVVMLFALASCGSKPADSTPKQDPIVLKLGHALEDGNPVDISAEELAQKVYERTNGMVEIQVFPAQQLGNEKDMVESLKLGTMDMGILVGGPYGYIQPEFEVLSMAYLFDGFEQAEKALTGEIADEFKDLLLKNTGVRALDMFWLYGARDLTANVPIYSPEDLKGMKIRVPEVPIQKEGLTAMGASATPVDYNELYLALQTGVVDGQENPVGTIVSANFDQVQDYIMLTHHIITEYIVSINDGVFQKIPAEYQKILEDTVKEVGKAHTQRVYDNYDKELDTLRERGMTVVEVDVKKFSECDGVKAMHEKYDTLYNGLVTKIRNAAKQG